ncbi:MAG: hypothetical protein ACOVOC_05485 [Rhabdaerophilum sp.]
MGEQYFYFKRPNLLWKIRQLDIPYKIAPSDGAGLALILRIRVGNMHSIRLVAFVALLCALVAGCNPGDDIPDRAPSLTYERFSYGVQSDAALGANEKAYWMKALVSKYTEHGPKDVPAKLSWIPAPNVCGMQAPKPGARVVLVYLIPDDRLAQVFSISKASITERANEYVTQWRHDGREPTPSTKFSADYMTFGNVVITDKSEPLHLVLASPVKMIWNIVAMDGVTISGVSILAERESGIANLPANVPISMISPVGMKGCAFEPTPPLPAKADIFKMLKVGQNSAQSDLDRRNQHYRKFADWFRSVYGVDPTSRTVGGTHVSNALVGPPPAALAERVPYRSLKGAELRMSKVDHIVFGGRDEYRRKNAELVKEVANKMAGGNLAALNK